MRNLVLALVLTACSADHGGAITPHPDATIAPSGPDADQGFCDAPANSAHVSIVLDTVTTVGFTSVHAGGTISGGDVAPVTAPPMSLLLLFVDATHIDQNTAYECSGPNQGCPMDGIVGRVDCIGCTADDLGPHPIMLESLQHSASVMGTVTITSFTAPYSPTGVGHIAGSISTPDASVAGPFENDFCSLLLGVTI